MAASAASTTLAASRRRLLRTLFANTGADAIDRDLSMRRAGRDGLRDDAPDAVDSLTVPPAAVRWLSRATFGFSTPTHAAFIALGANDEARWQAWLTQQLDPASVIDNACDNRIASAGFTTLGKTPAQLWADHHSITNN